MTPFADIYDKFLTQIRSTSFAQLIQADFEEEAYNYLSKSAYLDFKRCKQDLNDVDLVKKQFNVTLTQEEQWILAYGMVLTWTSKIVRDENKLKEKLGTKDYTMYSPANMLKELKDLEKLTTYNFRRLIVSYTYNSFIE